jgi:uncharacterized membrane protein YkvA (DUF1232 family)
VSPEARAGDSRRKKRRAPRPRAAEPEEAGRPRTGARRTLRATIRLIPKYLRLLFGLIADRRVAMLDKLLVAGAIAYIAMPLDYIPDFIPFLGQVDDVFLLMLALQRLIANAGRAVLLEHWSGNPSQLTASNLEAVLVAAAFFLPRRIRRRLRR